MTLFASLAPIIGGTILELFEFSQLLILSFIILSLSIIPLLISKDIKLKNYNFKYKTYLTLYKQPRFQQSKKAFFAEGIEGILNLTIWPILLFIILKNNFLKLGLLYTIISILSVFILFYLKNYLDKHNKKKILKEITHALSLIWFLRIILLIFSTFALYIVETIAKLTSKSFGITYLSIFYNTAKTISPMDFIIYRELYLHGAKIILGTIIILTLQTFGSTIQTLSIFLGLGILNSIWLNSLQSEN